MSIVRYSVDSIKTMKACISVCCPKVQLESRNDKLTVHARVNGRSRIDASCVVLSSTRTVRSARNACRSSRRRGTIYEADSR